MEQKKTKLSPSAFELDGVFLNAERYAVHCAIARALPCEHAAPPEHASLSQQTQACASASSSMLFLGSGSSGSGAGALGYGLELI